MTRLCMLIFVLVAGCGTLPSPMPLPPDLTLPLRIKGDTVAYVSQAGFDSRNFQSNVEIPARSYAFIRQKRNSESVLREIAGANCELVGPGFRSSFVTPARVRMPSFGASSQPATVTCFFNGTSSVQTVQPFNATRSGREVQPHNSGSAVGNAYGRLASQVSATFQQIRPAPLHDQYSYKDIQVGF